MFLKGRLSTEVRFFPFWKSLHERMRSPEDPPAWFRAGRWPPMRSLPGARVRPRWKTQTEDGALNRAPPGPGIAKELEVSLGFFDCFRCPGEACCPDAGLKKWTQKRVEYNYEDYVYIEEGFRPGPASPKRPAGGTDPGEPAVLCCRRALLCRRDVGLWVDSPPCCFRFSVRFRSCP